ncbi:Pam17-domain-containing protein [Ophiobolus disseminans]|uniref:Presequence translocated-associated motor subunit PAM17 n=1 Tax=Ophiobolus disseminans TaxID=1469910 RepID=A0A6A7AGL8_9PLEO|nr:Pam17-domain-containing protein [Ophiobolus disseminans]
MLARSAFCPARAFANRHPPAILAPISTATASFSTCTRPTKTPNQQTAPFTPRRIFPSRFTVTVRNASTASSPPTAGVPPTQQPKLTWNDFFALRRTRRRIGQGCSVVGAVAVTYYGLTTMMTNGYDATLSAQLGGLDPFMLMGLSTFGMLAAGWLIGPIFGNKVFNVAYRGVLAEFTAKDSGFFNRIKRHRVDPTASSLANPPPDYYGEKIGSVAGYRRWLKDQRAFNLKTGRYRGGKAL